MSLNIVKEIDNRVQVRNVLMSVSDKTGLEAFVPALVKACPGVKIYSTGGTYAKVKEILGDKAEGTLVAVSDYTGQPEMQGGREVQRRAPGGPEAPLRAADRHGGRQPLSLPGDRREGGRHARDGAHEHRHRRPVHGPRLREELPTDPLDYPAIAQELESRGGTLGLDTRFRLMKKAFTHTAEYDTAISRFFTTRTWEEVDATYDQH